VVRKWQMGDQEVVENSPRHCARTDWGFTPRSKTMTIIVYHQQRKAEGGRIREDSLEMSETLHRRSSRHHRHDEKHK